MPSSIGLFTGNRIPYLGVGGGGGASPPAGGGGAPPLGGGGAPPLGGGGAPLLGGGGAPLLGGGGAPPLGAGGAPGPGGAGTKALLSIRTVLLEASICGSGGPPVVFCGAVGTGAVLRASGEIWGAKSMVGC